jgi:Uma2 family endonuclease
MSAIPKFTLEMGDYSGLRMTAERYLALGETRERYELIDGLIVMSPSPSLRHNRLAAMIFRQLADWSDTSRAHVYYETDVRFSASTVYRPDIVAFVAGRIDPRAEALDLAPDLIVEVLSSNRGLDLVTKRHDYERFGVAEYWVVDPESAGLRGWRRSSPAAPFDEFTAEDGFLPSSALPGFSLEFAPLRAIAQC